jgi:uncharacterized protein YcgI (DUF1989 family)
MRGATSCSGSPGTTTAAPTTSALRSPPEIPAPLNMFMNIPVGPGGAISWEPSIAGLGSHVVLRAEIDLVLVFSACPQDIVPINGLDRTPKDVHFEILGA